MDTTLLKLLGGRIRTIRKAANLSQERLAELSELHPTYISDIERGQVNASITVYNSIAEALGIPLSELVEVSARKRSAADDVLYVVFNEAKQLESQQKNIFVETAKGILSGLKVHEN